MYNDDKPWRCCAVSRIVVEFGHEEFGYDDFIARKDRNRDAYN